MQAPDPMSVKHPAENFDELVAFVQDLPFDPDLGQYRDRLFKSREVERLLVLGSQFLYIFDFSRAELVYVGESVRQLLGYDP